MRRATAAVLALALATFVLTPAAGAVAVVTPGDGGAAWTATEIAELGRDLDRALASAPTLRGAHVGLTVRASTSGAVLYRHNAKQAFTPASTYKLVTAATALRVLGPGFRFRTTLTTGGEVRGNVLEGDLTLHGSGDPTLRSADLTAAASAVAAAGISEVRGRLLVDDSAFAREPYAPGWTWDDFVWDYAAPISAAAVDENAVHLAVRPGAAPGVPAIVEPPSAFESVPVVSEAVTGASGSEATIDLDRRSQRPLRIVGSVAVGAKAEELDAAVPDPRAYLTEVAARALRAAGVRLDDTLATPSASGRVLWTRDSKPLAQLLPDFLLPSDNFVGEVLLRTIGLAASGAPGRLETGTAAASAYLKGLGIDPAAVTLADGCGMSQYDRLTPEALAAVLQDAWSGPQRATWLAALPVWSVRGSTAPWPQDARAAGRTFAKTGSMRHARSLAGYLATAHHGTVTFAFMADDWMGSEAGLEQFLGALLGRAIE